jgi:hypothetical protein
MSVLSVYLFVIMDKLVAGFIISACLMAIGLLIAGVSPIDCSAEVKRKAKKWLWVFSIGMFIFMFLAVLTPDTKQFAAIYVIPKVANNEDVRAMSDDAMKALRLKFREWLDSVTPKEVAKEAIKAVNPAK